MNYLETQVFAINIRAEIERTPALHDLAWPASEIEDAGRVRIYVKPGDFSRFVSTPSDWDELKAELLSRWPEGSR